MRKMFTKCRHDDTVIAVIPKSGSQSIHAACDFRTISNEDALNYEQRILFIRHPIERLKSAFSFFTEMYTGKYYSADRTPSFPISALASWETFVDYALENSNAHWSSQIEHASVNGEFIPNYVHRFEDIYFWWDLKIGGIFPHKNKSERLHTTNYRAKEIQEYFAEDLKLWRKSRITIEKRIYHVIRKRVPSIRAFS